MGPRPSFRRLLTFVGSGAANTLLSWLFYLLLLHLGLGTSAAYSVSFVAGIALAGVLNIHVVFGARATVPAFLRCTLAYLVVWALGLGLVKIAVGAGAPAAIAPLLVLPITVPTAYLLIRQALSERAPWRRSL